MQLRSADDPTVIGASYFFTTHRIHAGGLHGDCKRPRGHFSQEQPRFNIQ
jgi:hypothetical protein